MRIYEPPSPVIPLPYDAGDGRLIWQPTRHRAAVVQAAHGGAVVDWCAGTDGGTTYTRGPERVLDVLRYLYGQ